MFGFTKKRKPETLAKQFFQIVSDPVASEEFWTSFEARDDDLLRACVSRFCYLEWVAVYHTIQRRDAELGEQVIAAFLFLITLSFKNGDKLFAVNDVFAGLERELVLARLDLEYFDKPRPNLFPFEMLTRMALDMRNETYSRLVKGQTDLATVLMCIAGSIRSEIHGGPAVHTDLTEKTGDQMSCLSNDWSRIEALVSSL